MTHRIVKRATLLAAAGLCAVALGGGAHADTLSEALIQTYRTNPTLTGQRAELHVYWGAYLGTPDELLVAGPLDEVADDILRVRAEARGRKGWIMDTYLLRRGAEER